MIFKWKERFETGIEEIDKQHKRLFEIGTEIYNLTTKDDGTDYYDAIVGLINELKDYTVYHFRYEESLLEQANYSDLAAHKIEHQKFIDKLNETEANDIDINQKQVLMDMIEFIIGWVSGHIVGIDFKYRELLLEKLK